MIAPLRKYIITGLLVCLPLAATAIIIKLLIDLLDNPLLLLALEYRPENVFCFTLPGFAVIFALLVFLTRKTTDLSQAVIAGDMMAVFVPPHQTRPQALLWCRQHIARGEYAC